jgi:hypothetical protein
MIQRYPQGFASGGERRLSAPTRTPLSGIDRAHADRLCTRRLLASLADAIGLPATSSASSRLRLCSRLRHLHPSHCIPARRQSQRAQYLSFSATSPVSAGHKEWLVCMGVSRAIPGIDSRRRPVRIRRVGHQWATRGQDHEGAYSEQPRAPIRLAPTAGDDQSVAAMAKGLPQNNIYHMNCFMRCAPARRALNSKSYFAASALRAKGKTAHPLLAEFAPFEDAVLGHLWARGYFCCSSGNVTDEVVAKTLPSKTSIRMIFE